MVQLARRTLIQMPFADNPWSQQSLNTSKLPYATVMKKAEIIRETPTVAISLTHQSAPQLKADAAHRQVLFNLHGSSTYQLNLTQYANTNLIPHICLSHTGTNFKSQAKTSQSTDV